MVAQTKIDVRSVADKPVAAGSKGVQKAAIVDGRELLDDQAAAAAVVDADQADAIAVQVAADGGILPTEAPVRSIGEIAQAPAPTTTDTTTAATTPPPVEGAAGLSPWAIAGIAVGGGLALWGISEAFDGDDNDRPAEPPAPEPPPAPPPPAPPPAPPANVAPTSPATTPVVADADSVTTLSAANFPFLDADTGDVLTSVRIGTITPNAIPIAPGESLQIDSATGHGYELVAAAGTTYEAASAAATAKGGYLAILSTEAEMAMVNDWYTLSAAATGSDGTWVGATQAADSASLSAGWTWADGTPLDASGTSTLWNNVSPSAEPNDADGTENNAENFAAIFDGTGPTDTHLIYDAGPDGGTGTQAQYLIEYDSAATSPLTLGTTPVVAGTVIPVDQLANLSWNSVFNTGGTVTFAVGDNDGAYSAENTLTISAPAVTMDGGASQSIATLVDDQHLSVLA